MTTWDFAMAEEHLDEMLDRAESDGPQLAMRGAQEFYLMKKEAFDDLPNSGRDSHP